MRIPRQVLPRGRVVKVLQVQAEKMHKIETTNATDLYQHGLEERKQMNIPAFSDRNTSGNLARSKDHCSGQTGSLDKEPRYPRSLKVVHAYVA